VQAHGRPVVVGLDLNVVDQRAHERQPAPAILATRRPPAAAVADGDLDHRAVMESLDLDVSSSSP